MLTLLFSNPGSDILLLISECKEVLENVIWLHYLKNRSFCVQLIVNNNLYSIFSKVSLTFFYVSNEKKTLIMCNVVNTAEVCNQFLFCLGLLLNKEKNSSN